MRHALLLALFCLTGCAAVTRFIALPSCKKPKIISGELTCQTYDPEENNANSNASRK